MYRTNEPTSASIVAFPPRRPLTGPSELSAGIDDWVAETTAQCSAAEQRQLAVALHIGGSGSKAVSAVGRAAPVTSTSNYGPPSGFGFAPPSLASIAKVSFSNIPHRQWLYGIDLVRGEIALLAAPGGMGKSSLAIGIAVSVATGRRLLTDKIYGTELSALYINAEDSRLEIQRRTWAFCLHHHVAEHELVRFKVLATDDRQVQQLSFLKTDKSASVLDQTSIDHFETLLSDLRPDVVVLDPLVALCGGGNLNDNAAMSLVMRALKRMANKFECAILILHHTRKGGDLSSAESIGGASAIVNLARRAIMAMPMTAEEAKAMGVLPSERYSFFRVIASKSNLVARSDQTPWYKLCSVTLPNAEPPTYSAGDNVQAVERVTLPLASSLSHSTDQVIRQAIIDLVDKGKLIDGVSYPYSPNVSGAKNLRSLMDDAIVAVEQVTGKTLQDNDLQAVVSRTIDALKADGTLTIEPIVSQRFRRTSGLKVNNSALTDKQDCTTAAIEEALPECDLQPAGEQWSE
jgi:AAA domain